VKNVLIVGEDNPYGSDPEMALYHLPRYASGDNLRRHLGLTDVEYEKIMKTNLCPRRWSLAEAKENAGRLVEDAHWGVIIMLGVKVKKAFSWESIPPFSVAGKEPWQTTFVALPHPSGLNRVWNEPGANERAQKLLQQYAPGIPWGASLD
jgi:hypothetical protein